MQNFFAHTQFPEFELMLCMYSICMYSIYMYVFNMHVYALQNKIKKLNIFFCIP